MNIQLVVSRFHVNTMTAKWLNQTDVFVILCIGHYSYVPHTYETLNVSQQSLIYKAYSLLVNHL